MVHSVMIHCADLPDPRHARGKRHVLSDLLTIAICAVICGAEGWAEVEEFGLSKQQWFKGFLELPHGIPSHDTFGRVFAALDPAALEGCFEQWTAALQRHSRGKLVRVDGKSLRQSFAHAWDKSGMAHLVSAFVSENRLVLGQVALEQAGADEQQRRDNEITVIPKLLQMLDLQGCTVSIDAIGCQRAIAQQIVDQQADYVLCVKNNQPTLHLQVRKLLDEAILEAFKDLPGEFVQETDGEHGRIEIRRLWVTDQVQHLKLPEAWPALSSIAAVERVREVIGQGTSTERHYYISSLKGCDAQRMAQAIRGHWSIENQLHWHLDVSFAEDACRIRKGHADENFSRLRRIALNLLQRETSNKRGIKIKRLRAGWDHDYLLKVLRG